MELIFMIVMITVLYTITMTIILLAVRALLEWFNCNVWKGRIDE
mgnify:CR=1 FL=1